MDCTGAPLPHHGDLVTEVPTLSACTVDQAHCFKVVELALKAQAAADGGDAFFS